MLREFVGQIAADGGHFGDDDALVLDRGHLAHGVDGQIRRLPLLAGLRLMKRVS
jgi:hypothetical protein